LCVQYNKRMNKFNSLALKLWSEEHFSFLEGAFVQKIQQPSRREIVLTLRNKGETKKLYINIHPEFFHLCFKNNIENAPAHPPMFCMQLRKHLESQRIQRVCAVKHERILELYFNSYDEFGSKIPLCLAIELMGKHSNIILYNFDTNVILGCAHNISSEKSRERELSGGLPYIYPPKQQKTDLLNIDAPQGNLSSDFYYLSHPLAQAVNHDFTKAKEILTNKNAALDALKIVYKNEKDINTIICNYFSEFINDSRIQNIKNTLNTYIEKEIRKTEKSIAALENNTDEKITLHKQKGDLILQNIYKIKRGDEFFEIDGLKIKLDLTKSPSENAQKYYALYSKAKTAKTKQEELSQEKTAKLNYLKEVEFAIQTCQNLDELAQIEEELGINKAQKAKVKPEIEKRQIGNATIYIGKNNKQNDYIVSKLASPEDLWFHALNTPGSHVLLKSQNPAPDELLEAAKLAKEYSTAKNNAKASIIYTKRKYLKKPPQSFLGYVTYRNEREIVV